jgi:hypothetical protein
MPIKTYLLLCLVARTWPFCYYVLFGFGISRKGEGDTRECGALSDAVLVPVNYN